MLLRIKNKLSQFKNQKHFDVKKITEKIAKIAEHKESNLAICIENTGSSYLGVKNATLNLFPNSTIVLPAYYSNILLKENDFRILAEEIKKYQFNNVVISTMPVSMNPFLEILAEHENVKVIFHGALSELSSENNEEQFFNLINYAQKGKIKKIGFVKSGLDKWCTQLFNIPASQLQLNPLPYFNFATQNNNNNTENNNKIKIGIFGNKSFNKNILNQVAAALLIENVEIHTTVNTKFDEFGLNDKIQVHPFMNHEKFVDLLSQMDLNMHLSFSEGMGGQVFTESLSQGVPCLTSYNNEYLKFDKELQELLTVDQFENPWKIKNAINKVLNLDQNALKQKLITYSSIIQKEHEDLLKSFLTN